MLIHCIDLDSPIHAFPSALVLSKPNSLSSCFDLQVHLSFSQLGGATDDSGKTQTHIGGSFVSLLLQSVGVAVTEVQDVEFK